MAEKHKRKITQPLTESEIQNMFQDFQNILVGYEC